MPTDWNRTLRRVTVFILSISGGYAAGRIFGQAMTRTPKPAAKPKAETADASD